MLTYAEAIRVLGLNPGASEREIKSAFRRLAQKVHPDKFPAGTAEQARASAKFREIKEACDVAMRGQAARPASPSGYRPSPSSGPRPRGGYVRRQRYQGPYHRNEQDAVAQADGWIRMGSMIFLGLILMSNLSRCVAPKSEIRIPRPIELSK